MKPEPVGSPPLLAMHAVTKTFPGVMALNRVDFDLRAHEIHALVGSNGAGKSTLVSILAGMQTCDHGRISIRGQQVALRDPSEAIAAGVSYVPQESLLVPTLNAADNILLGREPYLLRGIPLIDRRRQLGTAKQIAGEFGIELDWSVPVRNLPVSTKQMIAIAIAISRKSGIVIMDEPSASLTGGELANLFGILRRLRDSGKGIIYISHRLEEVFGIADRITILRDGLVKGTYKVGEITQPQVVNLMVGQRAPLPPRAKTKEAARHTALTVQAISIGRRVRDVSLELASGEILGLFGQMGSGRTELLRAIFGADRVKGGKILLDGKLVTIKSPEDAISHGIGFLTEDRKSQGLILTMGVADNIVLGNWESVARMGIISRRRLAERAVQYIKEIGIVVNTLGQWVKYLSGGNQQKVVLSRCLSRNPRILLLDEPTKGIDVGAKAEIYRLVRTLAAKGVAVLFVSSELPEILMMSDRVLVMKDGRITKEFSPGESTEEAILTWAM